MLAQDDIEVGSWRSDHVLSDAQVAASQVGDHASGIKWVTTSILILNNKCTENVPNCWYNYSFKNAVISSITRMNQRQ